MSERQKASLLTESFGLLFLLLDEVLLEATPANQSKGNKLYHATFLNYT